MDFIFSSFLKNFLLIYLFKKKDVINLFALALLSVAARAFSSCSQWSLPLEVAVCGLSLKVASVLAERRL